MQVVQCKRDDHESSRPFGNRHGTYQSIKASMVKERRRDYASLDYCRRSQKSEPQPRYLQKLIGLINVPGGSPDPQQKGTGQCELARPNQREQRGRGIQRRYDDQ